MLNRFSYALLVVSGASPLMFIFSLICFTFENLRFIAVENFLIGFFLSVIYYGLMKMIHKHSQRMTQAITWALIPKDPLHIIWSMMGYKLYFCGYREDRMIKVLSKKDPFKGGVPTQIVLMKIYNDLFLLDESTLEE